LYSEREDLNWMWGIPRGRAALKDVILSSVLCKLSLGWNMSSVCLTLRHGVKTSVLLKIQWCSRVHTICWEASNTLCSTNGSPLFRYSVFEGVANSIINSFSREEGTRWVQNHIFFLLLFICAYKAWVISPPCPHPLPYHPLHPLPLPPPPQYPAEIILPLFLILLKREYKQ
jgi:hypothetical protein